MTVDEARGELWVEVARWGCLNGPSADMDAAIDAFEAACKAEAVFKRKQSALCSRHKLGDIDSTCEVCFPPVVPDE